MIRFAVIATATFALTFVITMGTMRFPPDEITIATGPAGGSYDYYSRRYRDELARHGTQVKLVATNGTPANLRLLHDKRSSVVAALVQGGITGPADQEDLESLGTVFYEPLWLFSRIEAPLADLAHRNISVGGDDSGTQVLARAVLGAYDPGHLAHWHTVPISVGRPALLAGEIDALFLAEAWGSPNVEKLLHDPGIRAIGLPSADALVDVSPALHHVVLPRGAINFLTGEPVPPLDLVAPKASLVVRRDLHSAVKYLLLNAMRIHSAPAMFTKQGEFPAAEAIGLRLSDVAGKFYSHTEPFYYSFLPYWVADLIATSIAVLIPVYAVLHKFLEGSLARRRAGARS